MMPNPQADRGAVASTNQTQAQQDMSTASMPTTNRVALFYRMVSLAAMSVALSTDKVVAQEPVVPGPGTPAVAPAVPGAQAKVTDKTNITQLTDRNFCMDDRGNVLTADRTQVRRIGQSVQGTPSKGEALRAICEGIEELKRLNEGKLPEGRDVTLRIVAQSGEDAVNRSLKLNPNKLSDIEGLSPEALGASLADPMNRKAIEAIRKEVNMHVVRTGAETITVTFIGKERGQNVSLFVELAPQPKP
ncbi:MAG: hypothetical protein RL518_2311 [Pseudomonadota bacterium]|jgi:hypothetical protein